MVRLGMLPDRIEGGGTKDCGTGLVEDIATHPP